MKELERLELIKRNCEEIVSEADLEKMLDEVKHPVVYCGYEPSGPVHLGHFITILKLLDLEKAGFKVKVLLADWHALLNKKGDWDFIRAQAKKWSEVFDRVGFENAEYVLGTSFQRSPEYIDDVISLSLSTTVNRALRSMQEIARDVEHAKVSQIIYPFMQIVDMKALEVDVALGAIEQRKVHMLGKEVLPEINFKCPVFLHTPMLPSLMGPDSKMSSSVPESMVSLTDSVEDIQAKLKKAYCPLGKCDENSVLSIARLVAFPLLGKLKVERKKEHGGDLSFNSYGELEEGFKKDLHPLDLKNALGLALGKAFERIRG